jgi:hypothetical protein
LNNSRHRVCWSSGRAAGNSILFESICKAQAIDRRASSRRPRRMSQRGDSGTQARIINVISAGNKPIRKQF